MWKKRVFNVHFRQLDQIICANLTKQSKDLLRLPYMSHIHKQIDFGTFTDTCKPGLKISSLHLWCISCTKLATTIVVSFLMHDPVSHFCWQLSLFFLPPTIKFSPAPHSTLKKKETNLWWQIAKCAIRNQISWVIVNTSYRNRCPCTGVGVCVSVVHNRREGKPEETKKKLDQLSMKFD